MTKFLTSLNARDAKEMDWDNIKGLLIEEYLKERTRVMATEAKIVLCLQGGNQILVEVEIKNIVDVQRILEVLGYNRIASHQINFSKQRHAKLFKIKMGLCATNVIKWDILSGIVHSIEVIAKENIPM